MVRTKDIAGGAGLELGSSGEHFLAKEETRPTAAPATVEFDGSRDLTF